MKHFFRIPTALISMDYLTIKWTFAVLIIGLHITEVSCCTFPTDWSGSWYSSRRGELTINSTSVDNITTMTTGELVYSCFLTTGSTYVLRSTEFILHNTLSRAYLCLEMTELSPASIVYFHASAENPQTANERMKVYPASSSVTYLDICDVTPDSTAFEMLVKQGSESQAAASCPNVIRGVYNYTLTTSGVTSCGLGNSSLDVCTNTTTMTVNMSLCSTPVAYSAGGELACVYRTDVGSYSYTAVLNRDSNTDETTTYRFTCLVGAVSGSEVHVSQFPEMCQTSQTPTSAPSGGATLILLPSETCPSTASRVDFSRNVLLVIFTIMLLYQ